MQCHCWIILLSQPTFWKFTKQLNAWLNMAYLIWLNIQYYSNMIHKTTPYYFLQGNHLEEDASHRKRISCKDIILISHATLFIQKWLVSPVFTIPIKIARTLDYLEFSFKWTNTEWFLKLGNHLGCPIEDLGAFSSSCKLKNSSGGPLVVAALL